MTDPTSPLVYQSAEVEIDVARRELRVRGVPVPIGGRAFEIVEALAREGGALVTTDQLMQRVWPGAIVEENTLQVHISAVRKALGAERGRLRNVKGRGYRLLGSWHRSGELAPGGETPAVAAAHPFYVGNNLPAFGTDLIGRDAAVQELQDLLTAHRVITLTGPGGIGKTRLALEAARHMLAQGQNEVWLVELASLSNPHLVPSTVANLLGLRVGFGDVTAEAVARAMGQRKILLLLDNCEHVIDAVATFAETMIRPCPHATILTTSREILRIDGEYVYRVPPLDVPYRLDPPGSILKFSAVQLFVARTAAVHSAFAPDETNLPDIASICHHLDGIPLAIEFAAARAAMLGVSEVASDLDNRFSLLTAGRRTTLARHQTLHAALDWSYDLLTAAEQSLLRHVSIFPAGFTLESASAILRRPSHEETVVLDGIANLVAKSLVMLDPTAPEGRWRLLDTIRAYAFEKLQANGEAERALRGRAEYFLDLLTPAGLASTWEPPREAAVRYRREMDNIRATLDWCFSPAGDASIGAAITAAFLPVWQHFFLLPECRTRAEVALAHLGYDSNDYARLRMLLLIGRGFTLNQTGKLDESVTVLREGLRMAEALGDTISQMYALWGLWLTYSFTGNYRPTQPVAEQFLRLAADTALDPAGGFQANRLMGSTMSYRGNQPKARLHLELAIELHRQCAERRHEAWFGIDLSNNARSMLARVLTLQGLLDQARQMGQSCIERAQRAGHNAATSYAMIEAAYVAILINDMDAASKYVQQWIEGAKALHVDFWTSVGRCLEGVVQIGQRNLEGGVSAVRTALAGIDEAGGTNLYAYYLGALSEGLAGLGRLDEAGTTLDEALARAERDGEEWCVPNLLCIKGKLVLGEADALSVDRATKAEQCFRDAIDLAQRQGALLWELRGASHLAHLRLEQTRPDEARQILAPVYDRFAEGFDAPDLRAARLLLDSLSGGTR